ncbi:MAG: EutP/PduV family microcompartment system protein [Pygmaiobacter massiliensis]|nr:EutP/PduV family microcompartment system protein [Pygmaiobacter massiliensis]
MKRIMLIGRTSAGKTSFTQAMKGEQLHYKKTQAIEVMPNAIDTPGEYVENRTLYRALVVTAADADLIILIQSATDPDTSFAPGIASMFNRPVIGLVSKIDAADEAAVHKAHMMLEIAGCQKIFHISNLDRRGVDEVCDFLENA